MIKQYIHFFSFLKSIVPVRLSNSLWGSDVSLFSRFINIVFIFLLHLYWIHNIVTYFFVIYFPRYKEYMICLISFGKFSDVLSAFTCVRAIGNLWSICLGVNILRPYWKYSTFFLNLHKQHLYYQKHFVLYLYFFFCSWFRFFTKFFSIF